MHFAGGERKISGCDNLVCWATPFEGHKSLYFEISVVNKCKIDSFCLVKKCEIDSLTLLRYSNSYLFLEMALWEFYNLMLNKFECFSKNQTLLLNHSLKITNPIIRVAVWANMRVQNIIIH